MRDIKITFSVMNFSCIVLISLACLVLTSYASPIQVVEAHPTESKSGLTVTNTLAGRQAPAAVPAVPVAVEDDDDDDEEDDIEDALDDDDGIKKKLKFFSLIEMLIINVILN